MKVIGSLTSPFTRLVRVVCAELGLPYEFEITPRFADLNEAFDQSIAARNPLMRVPILEDNGLVVFDSRVIIDHLLSHYPPSETFRGRDVTNPIETNIITAIYGMIDAGVVSFTVRSIHPEVSSASGFVARSLRRISLSLAWLDKQEPWGATFGVPEAALISGLEWFQRRDVCSWHEFKQIAEIHDRFCERKSIVDTRIPDSL